MVPAASVRQALAALRRGPFALVVTDLRLPNGDGLEVVRAARALHPSPPVIAVTGFPSADGQRAAFAAGVQAYLAKPFSTASYTSLVRVLLGGLADTSLGTVLK